MNINIVLEDTGRSSSNKSLDNALIGSLKKFHTKGFRIDNPEWLDDNHLSIKVPVRLDEISELDNYLDKERYDSKRYKAVSHVVDVLKEYLNNRYSQPIASVECHSKAVGELFPGTYDLKRVDLYTEGDELNNFVFVGSVNIGSGGEYWTDDPGVII